MSFVGIPYIDGGRTRDGCDCFGIVRLFLWEEAGIELPSYDLVSASDLLRVSRCMARERAAQVWLPVERPRRFDVVLMAHFARPEIHCHVGVMIGQDRMLHSEHPAGAHLAALDEPLLRPRIRGFFRHARLAGDNPLPVEARHAA